ncbi:3-beta hydroxysteroid dehydrogenase isomerase family [Favolaschia claudopus]|uniref:3-beta hydroxysteroid dehydrogenase isomerase family n=1 Tax=Favolaschia claudopus TaxID=2862362 RepID=A0AAW0E0I7_9AGAR
MFTAQKSLPQTFQHSSLLPTNRQRAELLRSLHADAYDVENTELERYDLALTRFPDPDGKILRARQTLDAHYGAVAAKGELLRLAGGSLVPLSQVSHYWRHIVHNIPAFWTRIDLDLRCWTHPSVAKRGEIEADLYAVEWYTHMYLLPLHLLAQSSERWRSASFVMEQPMLNHFSSVQNKIPNLEKLSLFGPMYGPELTVQQPSAQGFSQAPKLRMLEVSGPLSVLKVLPLGQPRRVAHPSPSVSDGVELNLYLDFEEIYVAPPFELPGAVSDLAKFNIHSLQDQGEESSLILEKIFNALTVRGLEYLTLFSAANLGYPLYWAQDAARRLFIRSSSKDKLVCLCLRDVVISTADLLDCLALLSALEALYISDHYPSAILEPYRGRPHHLITSSLLEQLTPDPLHPSKCLVPKLSHFTLRTLGWFTDASLLEFLRQRCTRNTFVGMFEVGAYWLAGYTSFELRAYDPSIDDV